MPKVKTTYTYAVLYEDWHVATFNCRKNQIMGTASAYGTDHKHGRIRRID